MTKRRVAVVGAGLCGSMLAARLRNTFDVTVIEQARKPRPLFNEVACSTGAVNSTINRAAGLGGTTNYWHNALIELGDDDLLGSGIDPERFTRYQRQAWSLFLSPAHLATCDRMRAAHAAALPPGRAAHMVAPFARANAWQLAQKTYPGDPISVVYGHAERLALGAAGPDELVVQTAAGRQSIKADHYVFSAGGLATPALLAGSLGRADSLCGGYHDHPMAYVAKLRLRPESVLKEISCQNTEPASIRTGFVYQAQGLKTVFYLRPALNLKLASITGEARYILSDLRNDPFSPKKILQLLTNVEALREALLFKAKAGFSGDYYSVLMLGEQHPISSRGIGICTGHLPTVNWQVTGEEHSAYQECFAAFIDEMAPHIVDTNPIPPQHWDYRTAAHHSGAARDFLSDSAHDDLGFFAVAGVPAVSVCDASLLRRGGIANSGLTLVALAHQLADALVAADA